MQRNKNSPLVETVLLLQQCSQQQQKCLLLFLTYLRKNDDSDELNDLVTHIACINEEHWRIDGYCENWLPRYLDLDFFRLYRMTKNTFCDLLRDLKCHDKFFVGGGQPVPMEKALLMTLSWLGKGETLIRISEIFNVACSTVYCCTEFMLTKILFLKKQTIVWHDSEEKVKVEADFRDRSGFPGVIGAVDVCNIKFKAPKDQQESYCDKNINHSIKLQGIVSSHKIFTNIMVGYPGSAHDSRVFRNSHIYSEVEEYGNFVKYFGNGDYHLVGDKAYPLKNWILTPFKDNGHLTRRQKRYNTHHSITRIVVEHTFGLLKSRWRILLGVNVNSIAKTVKIIAASCILHNFCFIHYDFWNEYEEVEHDNDEGLNAGDIPIDAAHKRNEIADLFS